MKSKIRVIIFDFIGVLLFTKVTYKPNKIIDEIDQVIGKVTNDKLFKKELIKKYNLKEKEFDKILNKIVNKYESFKPLWKLLPSLKKKYKLAIINNGTSLTLKEFKRKYNIDEFFNLFISSAIEGVRKPNSDIYKLATLKLGVKPKECLFMDDSLPNINGAKNFGMKTIYWENPNIGFKKFKEFLK
ncbi:MAG: HAD-IA family hydrolase [Candidatus Paceibacterota bacterium]|jgi:HAD superfamily hydrolase (TIGR01509 family)